MLDKRIVDMSIMGLSLIMFHFWERWEKKHYMQQKHHAHIYYTLVPASYNVSCWCKLKHDFDLRTSKLTHSHLLSIWSLDYSLYMYVSSPYTKRIHEIWPPPLPKKKWCYLYLFQHPGSPINFLPNVFHATFLSLQIFGDAPISILIHITKETNAQGGSLLYPAWYWISRWLNDVLLSSTRKKYAWSKSPVRPIAVLIFFSLNSSKWGS